MHGQFSIQSRYHPAYETAQARDRDRAQAELRAYLVKADQLRDRLAQARIIEAVTAH